MGMVATFKVLDPAEITAIEDNPDCVEDLLFPEEVDDPFKGQYDIDKSWHAVHFLLTGRAGPDGTPAGDSILGGRPVGGDLGYGPARLLTAGRVIEIAESLKSIDIDSAYDGIDRKSPELTEIYLGFDFSADEKRYLGKFFEILRDVYSDAAIESKAVLTYLC